MNIFRYITSITDVWLSEMKAILKDEGVLLFFVFLPIAYPLIYSWIYNNEVVREVPVVLVDDSRTSLSREFANKFDASPDVDIALHCNNMSEARDAIGHGEAYGIIYIPSDFANRSGRMEQSHIGVYCDMSYMLTYKAIFQTATNVSQEMGKEIQKQLLGNHSNREDEISTQPLAFDEVPIFNTTGGYGNFILPGVLVLIIQQAMLLGVGMIAGTDRERRFRRYASSPNRPKNALLRAISMLSGMSLCYLMIFSVMLAWITIIVPRIFGFVTMAHGTDLLQFFTPYLLACVFFSIVVSSLVRYRESVMLVVVFSSLPLLFMSGVSWPLSSIPGAWQGVSHIFPSTFAIRGFVRMNSMGAMIEDVQSEYQALWILTSIFACLALFVVWRRCKNSQNVSC